MKKKIKKDEYGMKYFKEEKYRSSLKVYMDILKEHMSRQIIFIAIILVIVIFIFLNLWSIANFINKIFKILIPIVLGYILSLIIEPLYNKLVLWFSKCKFSYLQKHVKTFTTIIIITSLIIFLIAFVFFLIPQIYASISKFASRTGIYVQTVRNFTEDIMHSTNSSVTMSIIGGLELILNNIISNTKNLDATKYFDEIFSGFYTSLKTILNIFIASVVMIYSLNMRDNFDMKVKRVINALLRKDHAKKLIEEVRFAKSVFSSYLYGMILNSIVVGIEFYIMCKALHMPYTTLIAFVVGCTNFIPFFGPFMGCIPSFIIILLDNPTSLKPYAFILLTLVTQQINSSVIGPRIIGDKTGVDSFWVLFSILLFGGLFGVGGMVIAVPLWAVITRLFNQYIDYRLLNKKI